MKNSLTFLLTCILSLSGYSQDLSVRVSSAADDAPICYSYVYVNGKVCAVADSLGTAVIPVSRLTVGDTLSATFVGMKGDPVVYDDSMRKAGRCELVLTDAYSTDEVIVRPDGRKMYLKYVREKPFKEYFARIDTRFELSGTILRSGHEFHAEGEVSVAFHDARGYKILKVTTSSDTTYLSRLMEMAFAVAVQEYDWGTGYYCPFNRKWNGIYSSTIDYNGRYGNTRMFTSCYQCNIFTRQIMLMVDSDSKIIKGMKTETFTPDRGIPNETLNIKSDMNFRPYKQYLWLDSIESEFENVGVRFKIRLFDTEPRSYRGSLEGAWFYHSSKQQKDHKK